jgi:hypothetical protein
MTAQKRKKKKSIDKKSVVRTVAITFGVLIFLFLLYRLFVLISFKVSSIQLDDGELSTDNALVNTLFISSDKERINNIEVVVYSKDRERFLRIDIPTNIYTLNDNNDSFPLSSLVEVGDFLESNSGKSYTVKSLSTLLGLKFDNYVWLDSSDSNLEKFISDLSIFNILFNFKYNSDLESNLYSNLPILNLIKEINFLNQVYNNYQYEEFDVLDCCVEQFIISNNIQEWRFDKGSFDQELSKYIGELVSREVERERVNVEVYNASDINGLASTYARKIRHTGCRILRFDNSPSIEEKTTIYVPEPESYKNSLELIKDVVGEGIEVRYERPLFITTGDIILVLGKDLQN